MSDCSLCKLMDGILSSGTVTLEQAQMTFLCGVATGEYLAWKRSADLCESCLETIDRARWIIRSAAMRK
jgi:hypothetical protein